MSMVEDVLLRAKATAKRGDWLTEGLELGKPRWHPDGRMPLG